MNNKRDFSWKAHHRIPTRWATHLALQKQKLRLSYWRSLKQPTRFQAARKDLSPRPASPEELEQPEWIARHSIACWPLVSSHFRYSGWSAARQLEFRRSLRCAISREAPRALYV